MRRLLPLLLLALALAACGARKPRSADDYFQSASDHFRNGAYETAAEEYRELLDQHPFSAHTDEAELKIAHAHYLNESCPEAVTSFSDFQRRHPTSPQLAMVGYLIGRCYERQMQTADRDQTAAQNAHAYYAAVVQQYPESPFADLSRERLEHCRTVMADHEILVARYYVRHDNPKAAETRFLDLVNQFNDTDVAGEALYELGRLYGKEGQDERAALAYAAVTYHHPDHNLARKAERALDKLENENEGQVVDPLDLLRAETGRNRVLALAKVEEVRDRGPQDRDRAFTQAPPPGFGLPTGGFGSFGNPY